MIGGASCSRSLGAGRLDAQASEQQRRLYVDALSILGSLKESKRHNQSYQLLPVGHYVMRTHVVGFVTYIQWSFTADR